MKACVTNISDPLEYFELFFTDEMVNHIVTETNIFAAENLNKFKSKEHSRTQSLEPNKKDLPKELKQKSLKREAYLPIKEISQEFYLKSGFPAVYGAIDCSHIPIMNPGGELAKVFRCRKGYFSLNVQTISDASLYIQDIVACWLGSTHDSTVFETEVPSEWRQRIWV
ncbi:unnamed protein product [Larinioides sclopetarius]|uniref:DDE Tnp4 domain-containing protein n=1 Tax=Larinioides sclopetarius TaxID=280406 RepID=A0AAV1YZR8_9ARAC